MKKKFFIPLLSLLSFQFSISAQELLKNPGFEGTYIGIATSWTKITTGLPAPSVIYSRDTSNVHSGTSAQKIVLTGLTSSTTYIFDQTYAFKAAHTYKASIWLRSSNSVVVNLLTVAASTGEKATSKTIKTNSSWQQVVVVGGFSGNFSASFEINFQTNGTLWLDDASLKDVTDSILNLPVHNDTMKIPDRLFGIHINKIQDSVWPKLNQGLLRLWDSGTKWCQLEPAKGTWDWSRMDATVNFALAHDPNCSILYTMGIPPFWAVANPVGDTVEVTGSSQPPADINDWKNYVTAVANRYKGKIKYYEIWNEISCGFYTGSIPAMLNLSQTVYQILKSIDSGNVVLSPNMNCSNSVSWMDQFLYQGGGQYFDNLSFHLYPNENIEENIPFLVGIRNLEQNYGITNKPVWNTEGANHGSPTALQSEGVVARDYLVQWAYGIENFNWYAWDLVTPNAQIWLAAAVGYHDTARTQAGVAYYQVAQWLEGSTMTVKKIDTTSGNWLIKIERSGGYMGYIIWNANGNSSSYTIPGAWNIAVKRDLEGNKFNISGSTSVMISGNPILLENGLNTGIQVSNAQNNISIYPNPAQDKIYFSTASSALSTFNIAICDMEGKKVLNKNMNLQTEKMMDVSSLAPGMYFVQIAPKESIRTNEVTITNCKIVITK